MSFFPPITLHKATKINFLKDQYPLKPSSLKFLGSSLQPSGLTCNYFISFLEARYPPKLLYHSTPQLGRGDKIRGKVRKLRY